MLARVRVSFLLLLAVGATATSVVSVPRTPATITVQGASIHTPFGLFAVSPTVEAANRTSTLVAISDSTAVLFNESSVVAFSNGMAATYARTAHQRRRRTTGGDDDSGSGSAIALACHSTVFVTPAFISRHIGSLDTALRFIEVAFALADTFLADTDFGTGVRYHVVADSVATMAVPTNLDMADKITWLTASSHGEAGCANVLFDAVDDIYNGIAIIDGACTADTNWLIVNTDDPVAAGSVLAHEFGHLFHARHDEDVGCPSGYIMQTVFDSYATVYSACSRSTIADFVPTLDCLVPFDPFSAPAAATVLLCLCIAISVFVFYYHVLCMLLAEKRDKAVRV